MNNFLKVKINLRALAPWRWKE